MDITVLARKCDGGCPRVIQKGKEYLRKCQNVFNPYRLAKPAVCLLLASITLDINLNRSHLIRFAGVSKIVFEKCLSALTTYLDVYYGKNTTVASLCIKFGCTSLTRQTTQLYEEYLRMQNNNKQHIERNIIYKVCCLVLVAKRTKYNLQSAQLYDAYNIRSRSVPPILDSIEATCTENPICVTTTQPPSRKRPKLQHASAHPQFAPKFNQNTISCRNKDTYNSPNKVAIRSSTPMNTPLTSPTIPPANAMEKQKNYIAWKAKFKES